jgi:hypothetical protein
MFSGRFDGRTISGRCGFALRHGHAKSVRQNARIMVMRRDACQIAVAASLWLKTMIRQKKSPAVSGDLQRDMQRRVT